MYATIVAYTLIIVGKCEVRKSTLGKEILFSQTDLKGEHIQNSMLLYYTVYTFIKILNELIKASSDTLPRSIQLSSYLVNVEYNYIVLGIPNYCQVDYL